MTLSHLASGPPDHAPTGVLLTNVGTPEAPTAAALRPYLAQFLGDRRVVDYPAWLWQPLLRHVILRVRPRRSAALYRRVWTAEGSPLLVTLRRQATAIQAGLDQTAPAPMRVAIGLRYGRPSLAEGLARLRQWGAERLRLLPLFPQYSDTTTGTTLAAVEEALVQAGWQPPWRTIGPYYDRPAYIEALANSIREQWAAGKRPDRLLFSFHGIPQRYARRGDPYPQQCQRTGELVARALGLDQQAWAVAYQSRFGPERWLMPYTDELLAEWAAAGVGAVDVVCPGFSADCLETLDEIGREARHTFLAAGGRAFRYIPALNERPDHIAALVALIASEPGAAESGGQPAAGRGLAGGARRP